MKLDCKVRVKHNYKNINNLINKLPEILPQTVEEVLKNIQGYAIKLEKGHHEDGIIVELVETKTNTVKGRIYTDKDKMPFAMFEHFGTGRYAEMPHVGTTKHFIESGYTEWFIPVSKVEKALNYPIVTINETQFYIAHGMKANRFMSDASFYAREGNKEIVENQINQFLKEVCK